MSSAAVIGSAIVLGSGIIAHAAAVALKRAVPRATVTLIGDPATVDPAADSGPMATLFDGMGVASGAITRFHALVGLPHAQFQRDAQARAIGHRRLILSDARVALLHMPAGPIPHRSGSALHQLWLSVANDGAGAWQDVTASVAGASDAHPLTHHWRYDAPAYLALLGSMASALGVVKQAGRVAEGAGEAAIRDGALRCDDGTSHRADLIVDARSVLSSLLCDAGVALVDWAPSIPVSQIVSAAANPQLSGADQLCADPAGIIWQTGGGGLAINPCAADAPGALRPQRLAAARSGHVVAVGAAAMMAPWLDGHGIGAAFEDIRRLIDLLPGQPPSPAEADEYNRRTAIAQDWLGEWAGAQWLSLASARVKAALQPTARLAEALAAFDRRGRIGMRDGDPVSDSEWMDWLMATRPPPALIDPAVGAIARADRLALAQ